MAAYNSQDEPWKMVLRTYFREAITFFFPDTAKLIDWQKPPEFLDKEFQQISPDAETGRRFADQLVKVYRKRGKELWLLIHTEIQAAREAQFPERMFVYSLRIFDIFHRPAISLAILCDNNANWRPNEYSFEYPDTSLSFRFGSVKLLDYRDQWSALEASDNPFAVVVMAHLKAQETKKDRQSRKEWKLQLIRRLYEQGYNREDITNLFRFIDWVMVLPQDLSQSFWAELKTYEEERRMPYITSVEQLGFERGRQEGRQEGREEGRQEGRQQGEKSLLQRQIVRKFGALSDRLNAAVENLGAESLESLAIALLDFSSITDLEAWLQKHSANSSQK